MNHTKRSVHLSSVFSDVLVTTYVLYAGCLIMLECFLMFTAHVHAVCVDFMSSVCVCKSMCVCTCEMHIPFEVIDRKCAEKNKLIRKFFNDSNGKIA